MTGWIHGGSLQQREMKKGSSTNFEAFARGRLASD
jgi:hypothetical protein